MGVSTRFFRTFARFTGGLRAEGDVTLAAPPDEPADATLNDSEVTFWLDEEGDTLNFKVKYSDGTVKSGTVSLS